MRHIKDINVTFNLARIIEVNAKRNNVSKEKVALHVVEHINTYIPEMKSNLKKDKQRTLLGLMEAVDEHWKKQKVATTCKAGCSYCCHIKVDITEGEGILIMDHLKEKGISLDRNYLEAQKDGTMEKWQLLKNTACVFLKDNLCSIYEVRPLACRNYHVVSDPKQCDVTDVNARPLIPSDIDIEIVLSALYTIEKSNTMSKVLLSL